MALFDQNKALPVSEVIELRKQGLTDDIIADELSRKGYSQQQVGQSISQADFSADSSSQPQMSYGSTDFPMPGAAGTTSEMPAQSGEMGNIYERIEEITESMIDDKWDELIAEVKKIVEWKDKFEEKQVKITNDVEKLKEDFMILHKGVLGKLEDYDARMQDVGTELKAVGKVFKDVIPEFVDNVKELSSVTKGLKEKKE
ncbi:MAG: hypothetical protein ABH824_02965 [Nanoarchaeota archaeon]|nr:hypothetical protein [Nanoarchaeota archaeon]